MSDSFYGEISMMPYTFTPEGWAACEGQLMPIGQNSALFSLIGTMYGGDGRVSFAIPNLIGRTPIHSGQGPGLINWGLSQFGGDSSVYLTTEQIPPHTHQMMGSTSNNVAATIPGNLPAALISNDTILDHFDLNSDGSELDYESVAFTGGEEAHENRQPWLAIKFFICLDGIYPSRS
ncbi:phage tail protein [Pseudoalteromonas sp. A22]|uniref:phage tail protein n=1 Tax=Pseudoalteromonas TaxID=53246 RepID=UPI001BAD7A3B|nr:MULTISPECIES: tail fiber protein [Pseudoalteromonas]QUI61228.1 phage tail protein [Pseudoalteromonas sp. A22]USE71309.1 phage tail protein [Pseudoalteromonas flavipulchra]